MPRQKPPSVSPDIFAPAARELTTKQAAYVEAYVDNGGHGTNAATTAGYSKTSAASESSRLLRNPLIQQEIQKRMIMELGLSAPAALQQIKRLSRTAKSDYVKLEASRDLLDRAGFRAPDRVDVRLDSEVRVSLDILPSSLDAQ